MYKIIGFVISIIPAKKIYDSIDQWLYAHSSKQDIILTDQNKQLLNNLIVQNPLNDNKYFLPGFNYNIARQTILQSCLHQKNLNHAEQDNQLQKLQTKNQVTIPCQQALDFFLETYHDAQELQEERRKRIKRSPQTYLQYERKVSQLYERTKQFKEQSHH